MRDGNSITRFAKLRCGRAGSDPVIQISAASLLALTACAFLIALTACALASRRLLRRAPEGAACEAISVVIPLRGRDDRLSGNLRAWIDVSFASETELIAIADSASDPAWLELDVAEQGATGRRFRRLVSQGSLDWLPKVRALQTGLDAALHPRLVFANSDVRITPSILAEVVARSCVPGTGAAYAHPVVVNPCGVGGVLDAAVTNFTSLIVQPLLAAAKFDCLAGDLWAASAATLRRARIFEAIRGEIADDLASSRRLRALGLKLQLCSKPVPTQRASMTVCDFYYHQLMWLRIWHRYAPLGRATAMLFSPLAWAIAGCLFDPSYCRWSPASEPARRFSPARARTAT